MGTTRVSLFFSKSNPKIRDCFPEHHEVLLVSPGVMWHRIEVITLSEIRQPGDDVSTFVARKLHFATSGERGALTSYKYGQVYFEDTAIVLILPETRFNLRTRLLGAVPSVVQHEIAGWR